MVDGEFHMLMGHVMDFRTGHVYKSFLKHQKEVNDEINRNASPLQLAKENEERKSAENQQEVRQVSEVKQRETFAGVQANAECKRSAKELRDAKTKRKRIRKASNMIAL